MENEVGVKKEALAATEEATPTWNAPPLLLEKEPEASEKYHNQMVGEESAKDYFNQFKAMPAQKHWICRVLMPRQ
nr:unnamed protein product [Digitaria exilis]